MKIVTTFHPPSSVVTSLKCQLGARDVEHLVVAKCDRLEVFSLRHQGLHLECTTEIWGMVGSIKALPLSGSKRSNLIMMITHPDPELVFLALSESEDGTCRLVVKKQLSVYENTPRMAEFFNDIVVHPSGKIAVAHYYSGKMKVIVLKSGNYQEDFDVSLSEVNLLSMTFLYSPGGELTLAILHHDYNGCLQLIARDISLTDLELSPQPSLILPPAVISKKFISHPTEQVPILIPVPPLDPEEDDEPDTLFQEQFLGGVLIVGGSRILLYELASSESQDKQKGKRKRLNSRKESADAIQAAKAQGKERERENKKRKPKATVTWPWSDVTAWCALGDRSKRFLLGDSYGRLCMLATDSLIDKDLIILPLGQTSPPQTLAYLTNQILYLGSHFGDSQLLQISPAPTSYSETSTLPIPLDIVTLSTKDLEASEIAKGKAKSNNEDFDMGDDVGKGCILDTKGSYITVLESFKNIAPIRDAILVDNDGSGQQIVTCSGGKNTGSVNILRNGSAFKELAFVPGFTDVIKLWSFRDTLEDETDSHLLAATVRNTYLFKINDLGRNTTLVNVEDSPVQSFITVQTTLAFANVAQRVVSPSGRASYENSSLVVQVVPSGAYLLEYDRSLDDYVQKACWVVQSLATSQQPLEIVAASINASQVALAVSGGRMVLLSVSERTDFKVLLTHHNAGGELSEISAISCTPLNSTKPFTQLIIVAYWNSNITEVFTIDPKKGFKSVCRSDPLPALPRSLLFFNFGTDHNPKGEDHHPYLLAGLSDGSVVTFALVDKELKEKNIVSLGYAPVDLTATQVENTRTVLASGDRAVLLTWDKNRLSHSPIMLKGISAATNLHTTTFKASLVLATPTGLYVGCVKELDKMHIRSIPLDLETPVSIAYNAFLKAFGLACVRNEPSKVGTDPISRSSLRIIDDTNYSRLSLYNCEQDEEITVVKSFTTEFNGQTQPFFVIGTMLYKEEDIEPSEGHLRVFTAFTPSEQSTTPNLELSLVASAKVTGCVYAISVVDNKIVATVNSSVMLFHLDNSEEISSPSYKLHQLSEWNHNYLVTSLSSFGSRIVAGDQISSVSLLDVVGSKIHSVVRDYSPLWPVCVEALDETHILGANDAKNLFTFSVTQNAGRTLLERDGSYHVADLVLRFIRGTMASDTPNQTSLIPEQLFVASSGRIGVIVDVKDADLALHLTELQRNLSKVIQGVGGVHHTRYRAPKNARGRSDADASAFGFLDGDFLAQFLSLAGTSRLQKVMTGQSEPERLRLSANEFQKILEDLQSLH